MYLYEQIHAFRIIQALEVRWTRSSTRSVWVVEKGQVIFLPTGGLCFGRWCL